MANYDQRRRNTSSNNYNENWDKNQGRYVDDNNYRQQPGNDAGFMDLDRDGNVGNTGGFYGGTSYLGSNYGADWNQEQNQGYGNYGASGYGNRFSDRRQRSDEYDSGYNQNRRDDRRDYNRNQNVGNSGYGQRQQYNDDYQNSNRRNDDDWNYRAMSDMYGQSYNEQNNQEWQGRQQGYNGNRQNQSRNYYESAYGNKYDNRNDYEGNYGREGNRNRRQGTYGEMYHGNVEQRERETNQARGGRYGGYRDNDDYRYNDRNYEGNYGRRSNYARDDRDWWDRTRDEVASWFGDRDAERRRRMDERTRGEHRGKGPKEYRRSDSRIQEDICDRLADDDYLDASDVEVKVENGEVVLNGTVESRNAKRRAEDLVESISGVKQVQNNLRVGQLNTVGSSVIRTTSSPSSTSDKSTRTDDSNDKKLI